MNDGSFDRAVHLRESGLFEDALEEFRKFSQASSDPRDRYYAVLGEVDCLTLMRQFNRAERRLEEALTLLPDEPGALLEAKYQRASLLMDEGKYEAAYRQLESLMRDNNLLLSQPAFRVTYESTRLRLGYLLTTMKRPREARPLLLEALSSFDLEKQQVADVKLSLGSCEYELGELARAEQIFKEIITLGLNNTTEWQARYHLAVIYFNSGAFARARQELEACESRLQDTSIPHKEFYNLFAKVSRELGEEQEAKRYARMAK